MTLHRHWVRTANIPASLKRAREGTLSEQGLYLNRILKRAREGTLSEHGFVPQWDFKTCQRRDIIRTRVCTSMGL